MGIAVPMLDQCCCGCQLRTGTKFVGWCGVIFEILACILYLVIAFGAEAVPNQDKNNTNLTPEEVKIIKIIFFIQAVISLLRAVFSIFLLIGVYQEKVGYYLPWLLYSTVALVLEIISIITLITQHEEFSKVLGEIIGCCIYIYFILVVYSDYRVQKERDQGGL